MPAVGSRSLVLVIDDDLYTDAVKDVRVKSAESDSDFISFADAAAGGLRDYILALTVKQDTDADTLWALIWGSAGEDVDVEIWPSGEPVDSVPTVTQPMLLGTATVAEPDGDLLGGEANRSNTMRFVTEVEWKYTAKPVLYTEPVA